MRIFLSVLFVLCVPFQPSALFSSEIAVRFGISSRQFTSVSENDAKVAMKVWAKKIADMEEIPVNSEMYIFRDSEEAVKILQEDTVHALVMAIDQFYDVERRIAFDPLFLGRREGQYEEQMVLLVRRGGRVKSLADLRGATVLSFDDIRMSLVRPWLDTLLHRKGLPQLSQMAARMERKTDLTNTVLPVFFGKVDACLVTRNGFSLMVELNPQLAQDLLVIAESEPIVPAVFGINGEFHPSYLPALIRALEKLNGTPAGKQLLTILQCDGFKEMPRSALDVSLEMVREYRAIQ